MNALVKRPKRLPVKPLVIVLALLTAAAGAMGATEQPARELAICSDPANLPYSNAQREGFENRIATLLADELHATLRYTWNAQRRSFLRRTLHAGACDVVMGLPAGLPGVLQTRPYYASRYALVSLRSRGLAVSGYDDPALRTLRIGLAAVGAEGANPPPAAALARRGLSDQVRGYSVWGSEEDETPQGRIVDAVAQGEIDAAILWGPQAGYFAQRHAGTLDVQPLADDPQQPALAFRYAMALSVRRGDAALRDELQQALDRRAADIRNILESYGVPLDAGTSGPLAIHQEH